MSRPRVFITYAREDDGYVEWVRRLARTLHDAGFAPRVDELHLGGRTVHAFMRSEIRKADRVLVLGSPGYRARVEADEDGDADSGAGYESRLLDAFAEDHGADAIVVAWARGSRSEALPYGWRGRLAVDLTDPHHRDAMRTLVERLGRGREQAHDEAHAFDGIESLVDPLPDAWLMVEARQWVAANWPDGRPESIHPTWDDLTTGRLRLGSAIERVERHLDAHGRALIVGRSASGKSVLGMAALVRRARIVGERAFVLDLKGYDDIRPDEVRADLKRFLTLRGTHTLLLDNAHLQPASALWLLDQIDRRRCRHRVIIAARPLAAGEPTRAGLRERLVGVGVELVPDARSFRGVVEHLTARTRATPDWDDAALRAWVDDFGRDLVAFGIAVTRALPDGRPSPALARDHIERAYIGPVLGRPEALAALQATAALATLDLSVPGAAFGGALGATLPELVSAGLLSRHPGTGHWQLAHAGLGEMIIEARAAALASTPAALRARTLAAFCLRVPGATTVITHRILATADEPQLSAAWRDAFEANPDLGAAWMQTDPYWAALLSGRFSLPWRVDAVRTRSAAFLDRLTRLPVRDVASVAQFVAGVAPGVAADLVSHLLDHPAFDARMREAGGADIAHLLVSLDADRRAAHLAEMLVAPETWSSSNDAPGVELLLQAARMAPATVAELLATGRMAPSLSGASDATLVRALTRTRQPLDAASHGVLVDSVVDIWCTPHRLATVPCGNVNSALPFITARNPEGARRLLDALDGAGRIDEWLAAGHRAVVPLLGLFDREVVRHKVAPLHADPTFIERLLAGSVSVLGSFLRLAPDATLALALAADAERVVALATRRQRDALLVLRWLARAGRADRLVELLGIDEIAEALAQDKFGQIRSVLLPVPEPHLSAAMDLLLRVPGQYTRMVKLRLSLAAPLDVPWLRRALDEERLLQGLQGLPLRQVRQILDDLGRRGATAAAARLLDGILKRPALRRRLEGLEPQARAAMKRACASFADADQLARLLRAFGPER